MNDLAAYDGHITFREKCPFRMRCSLEHVAHGDVKLVGESASTDIHSNEMVYCLAKGSAAFPHGLKGP